MIFKWKKRLEIEFCDDHHEMCAKRTFCQHGFGAFLVKTFYYTLSARGQYVFRILDYTKSYYY